MCFALVTTTTNKYRGIPGTAVFFHGKYRGRNFEYRPSLRPYIVRHLTEILDEWTLILYVIVVVLHCRYCLRSTDMMFGSITKFIFPVRGLLSSFIGSGRSCITYFVIMLGSVLWLSCSFVA